MSASGATYEGCTQKEFSIGMNNDSSSSSNKKKAVVTGYCWAAIASNILQLESRFRGSLLKDWSRWRTKLGQWPTISNPKSGCWKMKKSCSKTRSCCSKSRISSWKRKETGPSNPSAIDLAKNTISTRNIARYWQKFLLYIRVLNALKARLDWIWAIWVTLSFSAKLSNNFRPSHSTCAPLTSTWINKMTRMCIKL